MFKSFIAITALFAGLTVFQTPAQAYCSYGDTACELEERVQELESQQRTMEQRSNCLSSGGDSHMCGIIFR